MADPRGFLRVRQRELPPSRPVPVRIRDWKEVRESRAEDSAMLTRQASRCMDCGIPFCHHGCPLGNLIPEWNELARTDRWDAAIERLHATNNFPEFTGRLCPAPCETSCVLGINQPPVTIKNIEQTIIDVAFDKGLVTPRIPDRLTGSTVAVIGSGPAGLAAAQQLTRAGHTVAVYEQSDRIGGLLRYGIPEFKMEKRHLDARLAQLEAEGIQFRSRVRIGSPGHLSGADLRERYDAIVLALGTPQARDLAVVGRDLTGIHQAMEYLPQANRAALGEEVPGQILATDADVVVIGGGDTGADCVGTAHRQGARSVVQLEIMPRPPAERPRAQPWPTYPMLYRVSSAHEEGGERVYATSTAQFLADDRGRVRALRVEQVDLTSGRPEPIPGTERMIPAQLVLLAMGFTGVPAGGVLEQLDVDTDDRGRIVRGADFGTSTAGVYAAGDCGRGQSLIVWAIAEGRSAAAAVDSYLRGHTDLPAPIAADTMAMNIR